MTNDTLALPLSPYAFPVYGLKLQKRDPIVDATGNVIDDGENRPILLSGSDDEAAAKFFLKNIKANVKPHQWKIWLEKSSV